MEFGWILLGLACWVFVILLAIILMQVADDQEGAPLKGESGMPRKPETPIAKPGPRPPH